MRIEGCGARVCGVGGNIGCAREGDRGGRAHTARRRVFCPLIPGFFAAIVLVHVVVWFGKNPKENKKGWLF